MFGKSIMKIYPINDLFDGRFALAPHPKGGDMLNSEILDIKKAGYSLLVSMLTAEEQESLQLTEEKALCNSNGLSFLNYPIRDEVADSDDATIEFVELVCTELNKHKKVLIHCRGGVGRSSMIIALVLARKGIPLEQVFTSISQARGEKTPESDFQYSWVEQLTRKT